MNDEVYRTHFVFDAAGRFAGFSGSGVLLFAGERAVLAQKCGLPLC